MSRSLDMSAVTRAFDTTELLLLTLSFVAFSAVSDPVDDQEPRAAITADRARSLYQLLNCQRVCKNWRTAIRNDPNLQRALFRSPCWHPTRDWIVSDEPSAYPDKSNQRPVLNPMIQHFFSNSLFAFSPLRPVSHGEDLARHQACFMVERNDLAKLKAPRLRPLLRSSSPEELEEIFPSWCHMQLAIPPVVGLAHIPWDGEDDHSDTFCMSWSVKEEGITAGYIMAAIEDTFDDYPTLNTVNVYTISPKAYSSNELELQPRFDS